jgi:hypothetical protein
MKVSLAVFKNGSSKSRPHDSLESALDDMMDIVNEGRGASLEITQGEHYWTVNFFNSLFRRVKEPAL